MARKVDSRIIRTRKALRKSLYELVLERGYDDISIQNITDQADLGRATFYLHYKDKDDLLFDLMHQISNEFFQSLPKVEKEDNPYLSKSALKRMFDYAEKYYDFYRITISEKGGVVGIRYMIRILREQISKTFLGMDERKIETLYTRDLIENYVTGGIFMIVFWWLDNEMPIPSEEMAKMVLKTNRAALEVVERELSLLKVDLPVLDGMAQSLEEEKSSED
ncbi:MAG: TetR/AcrR family transcriptional regulator [Anaerolineaceae bacterium]|jgi:AcrR family transcriptional regulator